MRSALSDNLQASRDNNWSSLNTLLHQKGFLQAYHPRRTLDQFYFSRVSDTTKRDADQVVTRQTGKIPKVIMVDQLWLCLYVMEHKEMPDSKSEGWREWKGGCCSTILTSFPTTMYARSDNEISSPFLLTDFQNDVFEKFRTRVDGSYPTVQLAAIVMETLLLGTLSMPTHWSVDILGLFQEAITDATEEYAKYFRELGKSMSPNALPFKDPGAMTENRIEQRRKEVMLGLTIVDIIDELHMLKQLLETQASVLLKGKHEMSEVECLETLRNEMSRLLTKVNDDYLVQINQMIANSNRLQKGVLDLLDLQQKEEGIYQTEHTNQQLVLSNQQLLFTAKQALSAQDQAEATNRQSQILFVFTVITIVFLPLSFFTSYFGMNIIDPKNSGEGSNWELGYVRKVMGASSGAISFVLIVGSIGWYVSKISQSKDRNARELNRLKDKGNLPKGLIEEGSPEHKRMQKVQIKDKKRASRKAAARPASPPASPPAWPVPQDTGDPRAYPRAQGNAPAQENLPAQGDPLVQEDPLARRNTPPQEGPLPSVNASQRRHPRAQANPTAGGAPMPQQNAPTKNERTASTTGSAGRGTWKAALSRTFKRRRRTVLNPV
jgi:Mg2+ and Co2+ transporter CorA